MKNEKRNWLPWLVLIGTIIVRGFATGLNTVFSLFLALVSKELGTEIGTLSIYYSIISVVQIIWFSYAGRLLNKYDVRWVSAAAVCLQTIAYAALGFMRQVTGWYVLAIPLAMGAGVLVNLLGPILVNRWFYKNTGTILGIQAAFLNGLVTPSVMVTAPILTEILFGKSDYEKIYAKVSTGVPLASIFLIPIYGFIYDMTGNYLIVLFILIILLLLAGASSAYGWKHKQRNESETNLQL